MPWHGHIRRGACVGLGWSTLRALVRDWKPVRMRWRCSCLPHKMALHPQRISVGMQGVFRVSNHSLTLWSRPGFDIAMRSLKRRFNDVYALLTPSERASEHRRSHNSCKHASQKRTAGDDCCRRFVMPRVEMIATRENTADRPQLLHFFMTSYLLIPFVEQSEKCNELRQRRLINQDRRFARPG